MQPRLDYAKTAPGAYQAMAGMERYVRQCGLEHTLLELVKTRASQINGCAYCIDMHTKDARAAGETEQRLYALTAWRETPFYTPRERAALEWTEALTRISENDVPDELYARVLEHFSEAEVVNLTLAIITINGWNRLAIPFRTTPGAYEVGR
jgi:AhpD family alkylhydroperoxidase